MDKVLEQIDSEIGRLEQAKALLSGGSAATPRRASSTATSTRGGSRTGAGRPKGSGSGRGPGRPKGSGRSNSGDE